MNIVCGSKWLAYKIEKGAPELTFYLVNSGGWGAMLFMHGKNFPVAISYQGNELNDFDVFI